MQANCPWFKITETQNQYFNNWSYVHAYPRAQRYETSLILKFFPLILQTIILAQLYCPYSTQFDAVWSEI